MNIWLFVAWLLRADLMMLKTIYGVLSFPFAVFATPLAPFLLHLRETVRLSYRMNVTAFINKTFYVRLGC